MSFWRKSTGEDFDYLNHGSYATTSDATGGMTDEQRTAGSGSYKPDPIDYSDRDYSSGDSTQTSSDSIESASDKMARITRDQWADYKLRFQPYEDRLAAAFKNGGLLEGERERIPTVVDQSFNSMKGMADRSLSRYGMQSTGLENEARDRSMGLNKSLATVDAYNTLYKTADERQDKLMTGGLSGVTAKGGES